MKYFGNGLSEQHKELNVIIRKPDKINEDKRLFLELHSKLQGTLINVGIKIRRKIMSNLSQDNVCKSHSFRSRTEYKQPYELTLDNELYTQHNIQSVNDYLKLIFGFLGTGKSLLFRGHSNFEYEIIPSVYREKNYENEHKLYNEAILKMPQEFQNMNTHLDYLVKMQHYGIPTRIIDLTDNPLVALYFACCSDSCGDLHEYCEDDLGQVLVFDVSNVDLKYSKSDSVSMICALATFSVEDKNNIAEIATEYSSIYVKTSDEKDKRKIISDFNNCSRHKNVIPRLLGEIRRYNPAFASEMNPLHLLECRIVKAKRANSRIAQQAGSFLVFGFMNDRIISSIDRLHLLSENKKEALIIGNKYEILRELNYIGISKSTLFPEVEHVFNDIKNKMFSNYN